VIRALAALVFGAALALGSIGEARAQAGNLSAIILPSASRTAVQVNSADIQNRTWSGAQIIVNVTAFVAGNYVPKVQGKDQASGQYYDLLIGQSITGTGTTILKIFPGIAPLANAAASDFLPRVWRVQLNGSTPSMTLSVSGNFQQ